MKYILLAVITVLTATSCRKVYDYIHDHPVEADKVCKVSTIGVTSFQRHHLFTFSYNKNGDPVSILDSSRGLVNGNIDQYFRYDRQGRLSDYVTTFIDEPDNVIWWHKYGYPRYNVITDTAFEYFGDASKPSPRAADAPNGFTVGSVMLDAYGRIPAAYDAHGNLPVTVANRVYDDKVNPYRTSKVFQFVYADYSRNNLLPLSPVPGVIPISAPVYNELGLPVQLPNSAERNMTVFNLNNADTTMFITYACSLPKGPVNY